MENNLVQNREVDELIDRVSEKFGYDDELKDTLKRIVPYMTKGKSDELKGLLYRTLERVKIFVLDEQATEEQYEKCKNEIMGDVNHGVEFVEADMGEYSKGTPEASYVNEPVFDENMNLVDRRAFLYVSKLSEYDRMAEVYGTRINLSHLIHELGHAWASEIDEYVQNEDGTISCNVGALTLKYKIDKEKKQVIPLGTEKLYIEEALNSVEEENVLFDILGVNSLKELKEKGYVPSAYQWFISDIMREHVEKFGSEDFNKFRYMKDRDGLRDIEKALEDTEAWGIMATDSYTERKKAKFDRINELKVSNRAKDSITEIIQKYSKDFFPDNKQLKPLEKLNNVFTQIYNIGTVKYNFGTLDSDINKEIYGLVTTAIISEGYVPGRQAKEIVKEERVAEESNFLKELKDSVKTAEEIAAEPEEVSGKSRNQQVIEEKNIE